MSILSQPHFHDEEAAFAYLEEALWGDTPHCPHCGGTERLTKVKANPERRVRYGLWRCGDCKRQFTAKVGTVFEHARIPMTKILQAVFLMCASKKGISAHQLHRVLEVSYPTAWFLEHRIREAMRNGDLAPFGRDGGDVEVDETFIGRDPDARPTPEGTRPTWVEKVKVLSLIDRESGRARSFVVDSLSAKDVAPILTANIAKEARLLTDEAPRYKGHGRKFAAHSYVNHKREEWVLATDPTVHTQTVEGYFSIFKRGMKGVYQHASKRHMHRYMAEFDFRYSNRVKLGVDDAMRAERALAGAKGKRLTYRWPH